MSERTIVEARKEIARLRNAIADAETDVDEMRRIAAREHGQDPVATLNVLMTRLTDLMHDLLATWDDE